MKYVALYANQSSKEVEIGEQINKGGACGKIFLVKNLPNKVIKVFHNNSKSSSYREKLEAMLLNPPAIENIEKDGETFCQIAWPEAIVEDENGFCVGYIMPLIDMKKAVSLDHLMQKAVRKKLKLSEKYVYRMFAAYNVASIVSELHKKGHYIIDLKPSNIYVYKDNMFACLLDCDGFSIKGEGDKRYPAEFVSEEYILPEGKNMDVSDMDEEQDKFALSVLVFRLLNNGIHPYAGTPYKSDDNLGIQDRIFLHHYPYAMFADTYQAAHPYSLHQYFDKTTLDMFDVAFSKKYKRPMATDWQRHLWKILSEIKVCKKNKDHNYWTNKGCGLCAVDNKFFHNMAEKIEDKKKEKLIRGKTLVELTTEHTTQEKNVAMQEAKKKNYLSVAIALIYTLLLGGFYNVVAPFKDAIKKVGLSAQVVFIVLFLVLINILIKKIDDNISFLKSAQVKIVVQIYALICFMISFIIINDIDASFFIFK